MVPVHSWEEKVQDYLRNHLKIKPENIGYFIRWIKNFLEFRGGEVSLEEKRTNFLLSMKDHKPDWQIDQASKAISIFLMLSKESESQNETRKLTWNEVMDCVTKEIRLQ
jgi:hypothetical protein